MIAATDNYTIDPSGYKAPDYGYAGLKYDKARDNFDRSKIPGSGPNPVVKVPDFWKKDQSSGIKIIGTESHEIPTVTMTVTIPGGHLLTAKDTSKRPKKNKRSSYLLQKIAFSISRLFHCCVNANRYFVLGEVNYGCD